MNIQQAMIHMENPENKCMGDDGTLLKVVDRVLFFKNVKDEWERVIVSTSTLNMVFVEHEEKKEEPKEEKKRFKITDCVGHNHNLYCRSCIEKWIGMIGIDVQQHIKEKNQHISNKSLKTTSIDYASLVTIMDNNLEGF